MAATTVDLSAVSGGYTSATSSVTTDGAQITGPPRCAAIYVRQSAAGTFEAAGGAAVPLDENTWTLAWEQSPSLPSSPSVLVKPATGTASVYARVV